MTQKAFQFWKNSMSSYRNQQGHVSERRFNKLRVKNSVCWLWVKKLWVTVSRTGVQSTLSMWSPSYHDYKKPPSMELRDRDSPWQHQVKELKRIFSQTSVMWLSAKTLNGRSGEGKDSRCRRNYRGSERNNKYLG